MQGRSGETDRKNRLVDTTGEREAGTHFEIRIDIYTPSGIKQIASGKLL